MQLQYNFPVNNSVLIIFSNKQEDIKIMYLKKASLTLEASEFVFIFLNNIVFWGCGHTKST